MTAPLDVHCELDDGFSLCGGNRVPRVRYERFVFLGEILASPNAPPQHPRFPWQRCRSCVDMITPAANERPT